MPIRRALQYNVRIFLHQIYITYFSFYILSLGGGDEMNEAVYFSTVPDSDNYKSLTINNGELSLDGMNEAYLHPIKVVVNAGGVITVVDGKGTRVIQGKPTYRGVTIYKQYYSEEDGYIYEHCETFHKGQTHVYPLKKLAYCSNDGKIIPEIGVPLEIIEQGVIWRD